VLQSFPTPRPTTNPYIVQLAESLAALPDVRLSTFSWRRALAGGYDVFHVHWPEILVTGRGPAKTAVRQVAFLLLLVRIRLTRVPLVRTAHNLRPQEGVSRRARWLLALADRWTTLWIRLNDRTPLPSGAASATIPHGHYRAWFARWPGRSAQPGRLAFAGLIRPYKDVEGLISVFREAARARPEVTLEVAGNPLTAELADRVRAAADGEPRIRLQLAHLTDEELVEAVTGAVLIALPYREMHNSGAALMALSLDRPVLVPDNEVTRELAAEVGVDWVLPYRGELDARQLIAALDRAAAIEPGTRPDLSGREWDGAGRAHLAAYRRAGALRGRRAQEEADAGSAAGRRYSE
jgi:glycosyltransferase involved in cell wall biosynthesis